MSEKVEISSPNDIVIAKNSEGKMFYVGIYQDDMASWGQDEWPIGHLVTWKQGTYYIGEKHSFKEPEDFLVDLIKSIYIKDEYDTEEQRKKSREFCKLLLKYGGVEIVPKAEVEKNYSSPDLLDHPFYIPTHFKDYPMTTNKVEAMPDEDLETMWEVFDTYMSCLFIRNMAEHIEDLVLLDIYVFDHTYMQLSLDKFSDPWDSGWLGFWACTRKEGLYHFGSQEDWKVSFRDYVKESIEEFNEIETGNAWYFERASKDKLDEYKKAVNSFRFGLWREKLKGAISDYAENCGSSWVGSYTEGLKNYCDEEGLEMTGVLRYE